MTTKKPIPKKILKAVETATDFLPMSKSQGLPSRFSVILDNATFLDIHPALFVTQGGLIVERLNQGYEGY